MTQKINEAGLNLIKKHEGLRLKAYPDPGTGGAPWTIGYGHTRGVKATDVCTKEQAHNWLLEDIKDAESGVNSCKLYLSDNQFSALVSFVFNLGIGNFKKSTMLDFLEVKSYRKAADEFDKWVKAGGRVLNGLVARRADEKALFLTSSTKDMVCHSCGSPLSRQT